MAAEADLRVDVGGGLVLANPVIASSMRAWSTRARSAPWS
jgi:hypothetical protein